jgi:predicted Zn finger-like uncharacterized protein
MRLVCLECSAAYEAPDSLFGPQPREVRCNRCGYQWTVVGSPPDDNATPSGLSIGHPTEAAVPAATSAPSIPSELPRPRPVIAPQLRPDPSPGPGGAPPAPAQAAPIQGSARLADNLAPPGIPSETITANEVPRPALVVEPTAESTRALLASAPRNAMDIAPPDPEERRLSHDLDFGESDRQRRTRDSGGGTRRVVLILILLIILVGIVAVVFETQIVAAVPALKATYAQVGL